MYGVKELKEALAFVFSIHMTIDKAKAGDGKIDMADAPLLIDPLMKVIPALDKINEVGREVADLTAEEKKELSEWIKSEYNIADDKLESKVEDGLMVVASLAKFVLNFKE